MNKPIPTFAIFALFPILALLTLAVACGAPAATAPRPTLVPQVSPLPQGDRLATREALRAAGAASATAMARRPVPTPTLTTEPVATPTATPQPGIGVTREKIENRFRRAGLEFEGRRLANGQYRTVSKLESIPIVVDFVGPSNNLARATILFAITGAVEVDVHTIAAYLAFLEEIFPEWPEADDWVLVALGETNGDGERSIVRGNKILKVADYRGSVGLILLTVDAK